MKGAFQLLLQDGLIQQISKKFQNKWPVPLIKPLLKVAMKPDFDVIICGAGPAGCTAALALGSSGLKIALIDKKRFPREKTCGDAIPAFVPKVLSTINPEYVKAFEGLAEKNKVNTAVLSLRERKVSILSTPSMVHLPPYYIRCLPVWPCLPVANITIFRETAVTDVTGSTDEILIRTNKTRELKAQLVIGCDGCQQPYQEIPDRHRNKFQSLFQRSEGLF